MADEQGFYRSDGIQNSGTGLKQNGSNCEIYNSVKKIYPRIITESGVTFDNGSGEEGYDCQTCRSGYNGSNESSAWRTDKAYQGYYNGSAGKSEEACGHFFTQNGRKLSVGGGNVQSFEVTYVKIVMHRGGGGWNRGYPNEGHLRYSNLSSSYKNGEFRGMRFTDINMTLVQSDNYTFDLPAVGGTVTIEGSGASHPLCQFIKRFMQNGNAHSLAIYNGENKREGGYPFSYHYAAFDSFSMTVRGDRTIQL